MKRLVQFGLLGALTSVLAGCPLWDEGHDNSGGFSSGPGGCIGSECSTPECTTPQECGLNETCGSDNQCHPGDCTFWDCPSGYDCVVDPDTNTASCQNGSSGSGGSGSGASGSGGSGASSSGGSGGGGNSIYCGNPSDCLDASSTCAPSGTCEPGLCDAVGCIYGYTCDLTLSPVACKPSNPAACGADEDCAGTGVKCVSGICTAPENQCFDQGQCANGKCADGKCTPACTSDAQCTGGYACDTALGLCTKPVKSCVITNDCGGPTNVCVDGACVPRSDGANCPEGTKWVENGCIADQSAKFTCATDGQQDLCAGGSICLHHSCYISCAPPAENACTNLPTLNQCKSVTSVSGQHQVCGSTETLGSDCDPQAGLSCTIGKICVDGFCK